MSNLGQLAIGICLGAGIALAGYFGSQTIVNGRTAVNTATVKGLAERVVPADNAHWTITYSAAEATAGEPDVEALYLGAEAKRDAVLQILQAHELAQADIAATPIQFSKDYYTNKDGEYLHTNYKAYGSVQVQTTDLSKVKAAYLEAVALPRRGVDISIRPPFYRFSGLNDIKPDMLREATENARVAADEFAKNAGVTVGGIQNARQGGFQVEDLSGSGSDTKAAEKMVRVVTTITFYLNN